jgi:hypothetical protein
MIMGNPITDTEPDTLRDLANADAGNEVYMEFVERDSNGIRAIRGTIERVHTTDRDDHEATVNIFDEEEGDFDLIIERDDDDLVLDSEVPATTHVAGVVCIELESVESLEIRDRPGGTREASSTGGDRDE